MEVVSCSDAKARGLKTYFTGIVCCRGHLCERYVSCASCLECRKEKSRKWYSDHDRTREKTRKWRLDNPERAKEINRRSREKDPERQKQLQKEWSANNREARREQCKRWYWKNAKRERERGRKKRAENIEIYQEYSRSYNAENRPRVSALARNRRAREKNNGGRHTARDVDDLFRLQKGKCAYCRIGLRQGYHVDHIMPLARNGGNGRQNLQLLCAPCNQSKSARDPIEYAQSKGMLI